MAATTNESHLPLTAVMLCQCLLCGRCRRLVCGAVGAARHPAGSPCEPVSWAGGRGGVRTWPLLATVPLWRATGSRGSRARPARVLQGCLGCGTVSAAARARCRAIPRAVYLTGGMLPCPTREVVSVCITSRRRMCGRTRRLAGGLPRRRRAVTSRADWSCVRGGYCCRLLVGWMLVGLAVCAVSLRCRRSPGGLLRVMLVALLEGLCRCSRCSCAHGLGWLCLPWI